MLRNAERAVFEANLDALLRNRIRQAYVDIARIVIRVVPLRRLLLVGPPRNFFLKRKELPHGQEFSRTAAEEHRPLLPDSVLPIIELAPVSHGEGVNRLLLHQGVRAGLTVRQAVQDEDVHPEMI